MTEREMEDLLWEYPERLLREPLKKFARQQSSEVSRADIVFEDALGRLLVIEVKKGVLSRLAVPQVLDHFGSIKKQNPTRSIDAMVIANRIPPERKFSLENFHVESREIPEETFREVAAEKGHLITARRYFMNNVPTSRLILDWDCFTETVPLIAAYGNRHLLLTSPRATRMGWSTVICSRLADTGCSVPHVAEVAGEPTVDLVDSLGAVARRFACDSVIAIGGGAVIDAAKAVAAVAPATFSSWLLTEWGRTGGPPAERAPQNALPVIAIPTIAAAGSEGNGTGVLTNRDAGTKAVFFDERLQPALALVDPSLTAGVSSQLTWAGALDIAAHAVEGLMSDDAPRDSARSLCTETFDLILDAAQAAMRDPMEKSARIALSKLAIEVWNGNFSDGTSRWPLHAIAHVVGAKRGIPHSRTVAMLLMPWVDRVQQHDPGRLPLRTLPYPDSTPLVFPSMDRAQADILALEAVTTYGDGARLENSFPLGTGEISDLLINVFGNGERA